MCVRPVHILNPKIDFTLRDKITLDVPCGNCSECKQQKQQEWFIRSYYQWLDCKEHGGVAIYITLTYDEQHVPTFELSNGKKIKCFSKRIVQLFLKRFRRMLDRHCKGFEVKYFICSELGDRRKRPHHHGELFLYPPAYYFTKYRFLHTGRIMSMIKRSWQQGIVNFGRKLENIKHQGIIESEHALYYVCKYVCKDIDWDYNINEIPQENRPFHLQSKGFGAAMIQKLGLGFFNTAFDFFKEGSFYIKGFTKPFVIPQYVTRKCLYDYIYKKNDDGTVDIKYNLNELGKRVRKYMEFNSIKEKSSNLKAVLSCCSSFVTNDERLLSLNGRLGTSFDCVESIQDFIDNSLLDYDKLACYANLFKDRIYVPIENYDCFDSADTFNYTLSDARKYLDYIYSDSINDLRFYTEFEHKGKNGVVKDLTFDLPHTDLRCKNTFELLSQMTYAQTFDVPLYELCIELYNTLMFFGGLDKERKYNDKEISYRNLKLLNSSHKMEDVI